MRTIIKTTGFAALLLVCVISFAQGPETTPSTEPGASKAIQLKTRTVTKLREILARRLQARFPAETRVSVYLEVPLSEFVLQRVVLTVDEQPATTRKYDQKAAQALTRGGADRLLRFNSTPGAHSLRLEFFGHRNGKDSATEPLDGVIELDFTVASQPRALVLPLVPKALEPPRGFFAPDEEDWEWAEEVVDPRIQRVRYLRDTGAALEGMLELLEIAGPPRQPQPLPHGYHLLLALSYVDLRMANAATQAALDASASSKNKTALSELWLKIAELHYREEQYAKAESALARAKKGIARAHHLVWLDLHSRVLMAQQKYAAAVSDLRIANRLLDSGAQGVDLPRPIPLYIRYNYAVALVKSGKTAAGRTLLDRIGQSEPKSPVAIDLRNRANLALAYHFLDNAQGASAKAIFNRLPLTGQYANRALLGLGWTELAPTGEVQRRAEPGTYGEEWFLGEFEFSEPAESEKEKLRRALVPWQQLQQRAKSDPAVQAALLAIPAALEELGNPGAAGQGFERAIKIYGRASASLNSQARLLRQGRMSQVFIEDNLAALTLSEPVGEGYASRGFNHHILQRRDLLQLHAVLNRFRTAPTLTRSLQKGAADEVRLAQKALAQRVGEQLEFIDKLEFSARVGLARVYALADSSGEASVGNNAER